MNKETLLNNTIQKILFDNNKTNKKNLIKILINNSYKKYPSKFNNLKVESMNNKNLNFLIDKLTEKIKNNKLNLELQNKNLGDKKILNKIKIVFIKELEYFLKKNKILKTINNNNLNNVINRVLDNNSFNNLLKNNLLKNNSNLKSSLKKIINKIRLSINYSRNILNKKERKSLLNICRVKDIKCNNNNINLIKNKIVYESSPALDSKTFLRLAFSPILNSISENQNIELLNNHFEGFKAEKKGGGASGATVIKLSNNHDVYFFKYSSDAVRKDTYKRIYVNNGVEYKVKGNTFIESNRSSIENIKSKSKENKILMDSSMKYIRAVREIYLSKKINEETNKKIENLKKSKKEIKNKNNKARLNYNLAHIKLIPEIHHLGYLKNCIINIKNNGKLKIEKIEPKVIQKYNKNKTHIYQNIYIPFILQSAVMEGSFYELLDLKDKALLNDKCRLSILVELSKVLLKFYKILKKENKYVGCHRDLHPGNIFVKIHDKENGIVEVKLIDFDLSITNSNLLTSKYECSRDNLNGNPFKKKFGIPIKKTWIFAGNPLRINNYLKILLTDEKELSKNIFEDDDLYQYLFIYIKLLKDIDEKIIKDELILAFNNSIIAANSILNSSNHNNYNITNNSNYTFKELFLEKIIFTLDENKFR